MQSFKVTASFKGEVGVAFQNYCKVKDYKVSTALRVIVTKFLVEEGYLPTWWLENSLSRQK